jgi:hypothetical protein
LSRDVAAIQAAGVSHRQAAQQVQVPRSTLQEWEARRRLLAATTSPAWVAFFESAEGAAIITMLVVALHVVVGLALGAGVGPVARILELVGLASHVANSVSTHQRLAVTFETEARHFGREESARLGGAMKRKDITASEDETFFPEPCLVAIEPVSNFILAEKMVTERDRATWDATMKEATLGLPVRIVQSTADEGTALRSHARGLGAHHSPDVFHVQHEVCGAMALALTRKVRAASEASGEAEQAVKDVTSERDVYLASEHGPGRPPNWDERIAKAEDASVLANIVHAEAHLRRESFREAVRGLSAAYHPVDLQTGDVLADDDVERRLLGHFAALDAVAEKAELPERAKASIDKARRVVPAMKATISFVLETVRVRVDNLGLGELAARAVTTCLVPAAYLERVANRAPTAERRDGLRALAHAKRMAARELAPELAALPDEQREAIARVAVDGADVFQRSSSCVEGRNGQLSLRYHHLHSLTPARLEAYTVLHNFFAKRPDGTTAAERFFGLPHRDLFEHLVLRAPELARPRQRPRATATLH